MIRRCIGIDIGSSYLHAVQVSRVGDRFCVERVFSTQTQRSTDSHPDILKSLIKRHGFDRRADVAIAVPHDAIFFANLKTDIGGLEGIRGGCLPALEHSFPVQTDRIVHQACSCRQLSENEYSVLVAAVPKASLRERLNVLTAAKMRASLAEAPVFAAYAAVVVNHPEINDGGKALIAHISESRLVLAVVEKNSVLMVRNIPLSCGQD
ncbi:MAG: pilus assembly protein PilM [Planctomycetota bacterium]|jgi:Tfp pilus assembly PilM family ATPase